MNAVSETLFHFVDRAHQTEPMKQFDTFTKIMENGLRFSPIEVDHLGPRFVNKCICFTDIPLFLSDEHTDAYGKFGIGFSREFVKNRGGNPAFYFVNWNSSGRKDDIYGLRGVLLKPLQNIAEFCLLISKKGNQPIVMRDDNRNDEYDISLLANDLRQVFSMLKEVGDLGPASDYTNRKDLYYQEREWRILSNSLIIESEHNFTRIIGDNLYLVVKPSDIRIITVPNDDVRKKTLEYLWSNKEENQIVPTVITYDELKRV